MSNIHGDHSHSCRGAKCEEWYNDLKRVLNLYISAYPERYTIVSRDEFFDEHITDSDGVTWPEGLLHTRRYNFRYNEHQTQKNDIQLHLNLVPSDPSLNSLVACSSGGWLFNLQEFTTDKFLCHSLFLFFVDENSLIESNPEYIREMHPSELQKHLNHFRRAPLWQMQEYLDEYLLWAIGYRSYEKRLEALAMSQQWQIREFMNSQLLRYHSEFNGPGSSSGPYAFTFRRDRVDATIKRIDDFLRGIY